MPCTTDQTLYQDQRYGPSFEYVFNVPAGSYQVTLKFAETYSGDFAKGARVLNVLINGTTVLANLDIYGTVGANAALDEVINNIAPASGGTITIQFTRTNSTDTNAQVEALQIIPQPATATPTSTLSKTQTSTFTVTPTSTPTLTFTWTTSSTFTNTVTVTKTNTLIATATQTNSVTASVSPTASHTQTFTLTSTPSNTSTKTDTSTAVFSPTGTSSSTPTAILTAVSTSTASSTLTASYTSTLTSTATSSLTFSPTGTSTSSPTAVLIATNTSTNTPAIPTATKTYSFTPSITVTNTSSLTPDIDVNADCDEYLYLYVKTASPTVSPTWTVTGTNTITWTATPKVPTATDTFWPTPMFTHTALPPTSTPTTASICSGVANWNGNFVYYAIGAKVVYEGELYQCIQAHTSESTWEPNIVPALWKDLGSCGGTAPAPALAVAQPLVYPNPVTSSTTSIQLPMNDATNVKVQIFTVSMRQVQTINVPQVFGNTLTVRMMDKSGMNLANGLYYFMIQASGQKWTNKVLVLR